MLPSHRPIPPIMKYPRMRYPSRIAFCGPLGAGKTTLALRFRKLGYHVLSFRDIPSEIARTAFNMDRHEPDEFLISRTHTQLRKVEPNDLVRTVMDKLKKTTRYVIDGISFPEEYVECFNAGFFMVYIGAPKHLRTSRMEGRYKEENDYMDEYLKDYEWDVTMINDVKNIQTLCNLFFEQIDLHMFDWVWRVKDMGITEGWDW